VLLADEAGTDLVSSVQNLLGCSRRRSFLRECMKPRIYVAQRFVWRCLRDARKDGTMAADQCHIILQ
jgi:hypothetical protein